MTVASPCGGRAAGLALLALARARLARGYWSYLEELPNGKHVMRNGIHWLAVGHETPLRGAQEVGFGDDFEDMGEAWTVELCRADSDGDGQTNGEELGDPDCVWRPGSAPARTTDISHPGFADSKTGYENGGTGCVPSGLQLGATTYACRVSLHDDVVLHWRADAPGANTTTVDLALQSSAGSYLSVGFPSEAGTLLGAHAVVGGGSACTFWSLDASGAPSVELTSATVRAPMQGAIAVAVDGRSFLTLSGVQLPDPSALSIIYSAGATPSLAQHAVRGSRSLNLLSSGPPPVPQAAEGDMDTLFFVGAGSLAGALVVGAALVGFMGGRPSRLSKPVVLRMSPARLAARAVLLAALWLMLLSPAVGAVDVIEGVGLGLGLVAGTAGAATMWLAFASRGLHSIFRISREEAWPIHAFFGMLFLAGGSLHGFMFTASMGMDAILAEPAWLVAVPGMALLWASVVPSVMVRLAGLRYDLFKLLHMLAPVGYLFTLAHVLLQLTVSFTPRCAAVAVMSVLGLLGWLWTRTAALATTTSARVARLEVLEDASGKHVVMEFDAPRLEVQPGQWLQMRVPSVGVMGHPFTAYRAQNGSVCMCVKAQGHFTKKLLDANLQDLCVFLEGPYGLPPVLPALQWSQAVFFVVGGVGVTPALSLLPQAAISGHGAHLFWSLRSPKLFEYAKPLLDQHLGCDKCHVQLTGPTAGEESDESSGVVATRTRVAVRDWLALSCKQLQSSGGGSALVFVCGPESLVAAARAAVAAQTGTELRMHTETFNFLPRALQPRGHSARVASHSPTVVVTPRAAP